jgi:hypothetical protein
MKTQLIPLESHDDLISVRDRMSWAKTPRILLVWPKSERIGLRKLDLKVLQRHAASLGAQLGLVVRHRYIRREAETLGIPVFNSTGEAQRNPWPERRLRQKRERQSPRPDLRKRREQVRVGEGAWRSNAAVRIGAFLLGVLAVLTLASLFVPRAQIILPAETDVQTVTLPVQADPSVKSVFITGSIPSLELRVVVEDSLEAKVTGKVPLPQTKAKGVVTFRNLTEGAVTIPVGTVLTSTGLPGVRFLTVEHGELPGGLKATIDIPVEAESAGAAGNVDAGAIQAIEGNLGLLATVTNAEPATGGTNRLTNAVTEKDLARLREDLLQKLEDQALEEMKMLLEPGDQLFPGNLELEQTIEASYEPPLGQPSNNLKLTLRAEFSASYASGKDLTELASTVLNASLPEGFSTTDDPITFKSLTSYATDSERVTSWTMRVSRGLQKQADTGKIISLVQGRSREAALMQLEDGLDIPGRPELLLTPEWWPWLPLIPFNITVEAQ